MTNRNTPFTIGGVTVPGRLSLGPMAGITDLAMREICREMGAALMYTEMVSAKGLYYNNTNTRDLLETSDKERPVALQLFGSDPEIMGDMAGKVKDLPFDFIDINMGCPVPKVVNNGEGSALMRSPELIGRIVEKVAAYAGKPVTVKIRKGFDTESAVECAGAAEAAGAAAVCVHGRLRTEYYHGQVDLEVVRKVKAAVKVPVIGSGDVKDFESLERMLDTGVDGVMIARAARGNPWIFRRLAHYLETGEKLPGPELSEVKEMVLRHASEVMKHKGEFTAMHEMRKHVAW
ncbi:MAG: tRNA dihydrouridine synthase DusB, partial [Lachnospiraceae bacterium]|nr:tRNA dihydrouridine synthase DusB [Lachnospiraceae bacterium]